MTKLISPLRLSRARVIAMTWLGFALVFSSCAPVRSPSYSEVQQQDQNSIIGTYQVTVVRMAGKNVQKADTNGIFNDKVGEVPAGYQMFVRVDSTSVQAFKISRQTNEQIADPKESYQRTGSVLLLTAQDGAIRQMAFSARGNQLTVQYADGSSMVWDRIPAETLQTAQATLQSQLFNLSFEITDSDGQSYVHTPVDLTQSKSVTCIRDAAGVLDVHWSQSVAGQSRNDFDFGLEELADRDFKSAVSVQSISQTPKMKIRHYVSRGTPDAKNNLSTDVEFASEPGSTQCSAFSLSITANGQKRQLNLQATCFPLASASIHSKKYFETFKIDVSCTLADQKIPKS
jgi:hypothetical protein